MAQSGKKRAPANDQVDPGSNKRRKGPQKNPAVKSNGQKNDAAGQAVSLDQLQWQSVSLPDHMEDVEGFFGLEEIDDIDVRRDAEKGTVQYQISSKQAPKSNKQSAAKSNGNSTTKKPRPESSQEENWENEEEWGGIEETSQSGQEPVPENTRLIPTGKTKEKANKKMNKAQSKIKEKAAAKKAKLSSSENGHIESSEGAFAGLEDEVHDKDVDVSAWKPLNLFPQTLSSISKLGFSRPTQIQSSAIPAIIEGHDVIGKAPTGSGKTLAYGIPILEHFLQLQSKPPQEESSPRSPIALIIAPTRELAHQLSDHLTALCSAVNGSSPRIATLTGGLSVQKQRRLLEKADVIIGTPGRLWEVISAGQGIVDWLKRIKFLIVDEADRLLVEGHFKEFEEIINVLDKEDDEEDSESETDENSASEVGRQTLIFSATFHKGLQQKLAGKGRPAGGDLMDKKDSMEYLLKRLNFREEKPKFIDVNPKSQMAQGLREGLVECAALEKDLYLYSLLLLHSTSRTLVFTNSISSVRRLVPLLQNLNISAHGLHSSMAQKARLRSLERFSQTPQPNKLGPNSTSAPASILIATDVAARGLDIQDVNLIVHYHLPRTADAYVHRSGRTARASKVGSSIVICAPDEVLGMRRLVAKVHAKTGRSAASPDPDESKEERQATQRKSDKSSMLQSVDIDRRLVARLKPRLTLAKQIADSTIAKEKGGREDDWLRTAAEELGVDYDSEEFEAEGGNHKGTKKRKEREREARAMTKGEVGALRAQLRELLQQRINVGISERYLTGNGARIDIGELLRNGGGRVPGQSSAGEFLGTVDGLEGFA
ncbi:MAG: hypothetical protein M4579_002251 [Chaenotheca gracillima]|nr:MAG: hypothetical protein M4579_002251 [Chaenotheca gracillima]